jgi:hypothetical protein
LLCQYLKFGDFQFLRKGKGTYTIIIRALHFKGGNGPVGMEQNIQVEPLRLAENLNLDLSMFLTAFFAIRGAFVIKVSPFYVFHIRAYLMPN